MWNDIDYMQGRRIFTVDPSYFPLPRMREIVQYLHAHNQKYILMADPAVAYAPGEGSGPYDRGTQMDIWMKMPNGSAEFALAWPGKVSGYSPESYIPAHSELLISGVTHCPDWFHPDIQDYWTNKFRLFYNATDGIDIDGAWIDMNEPSNAQQMALPPPRTAPVPDPTTPIFGESPSSLRKRDDGINLLNPPYPIENAAGDLSMKTSWTNATHANGLVEYDTHNLYGTMMSVAARDAMLARRPGLRTLVITRSTFAGAGAHVGKWLGDNFSSWGQYRLSIAGVLGMAGMFQISMVGTDICGYAEIAASTLWAGWAMLGRFYPFMRCMTAHNADTSIGQEFYCWPVIAHAARNVLNVRYRLMYYFFSAFHQANFDSIPVVQALCPSILISPVTEESSTSVTIYLPKHTFHDFQD
ncbi:glycoside hydrolase family 31 protein [Collybiopsis luxurians FD-317 M1]|uniref:Glycoside hydrolase family 31 protein n=1 Tax=Collybiopsis luxurians FD-317 M1 TaxID=944289 RepID=A0A0D0AQ01_9AGAR|nr:glycoside hydrolase family 31 protein [Collybiopsis luxurians FD-317 M1]